MSDYLKLINQLKFIRDYDCITNAEVNAMDEAIAILSETSAEPQKKGTWIDNRDVSWVCSECGKWLDVLQGDVDMNFCPNCGAKMKVKE